MLENGIDVARLRGWTRLAFDATLGLAGVVEGMHRNISAAPGILGEPAAGPTRGITGIVYSSIRGVTRLVGAGVDVALRQGEMLSRESAPSAEREAVLAAVNGVVGDHLAATGNPLAIPMRLRRDGRALVPERGELARTLPDAGPRLLVLVHGLCMSDLGWSRRGHDHGAALARDLGYSPVYLHYNSGLHVSTNGRAFAEALDALVREWPVDLEEVAILAHSMGGLVARSACHHAQACGQGWLRRLRALVFLGTPHHGAPLERGGSWIDVLLSRSPYSAALARLGRIRSAGITDLRHGSVVDEDWQGRDRFARSRELPRAIPLPSGVECHAVAGTRVRGPGPGELLGDGLVPLDSALGRHPDPLRALAFPRERCFVGRGTGHLDLLDRPEVYERLRGWLAR
jgi:hypothetical protein